MLKRKQRRELLVLLGGIICFSLGTGMSTWAEEIYEDTAVIGGEDVEESDVPRNVEEPAQDTQSKVGQQGLSETEKVAEKVIQEKTDYISEKHNQKITGQKITNQKTTNQENTNQENKSSQITNQNITQKIQTQTTEQNIVSENSIEKDNPNFMVPNSNEKEQIEDNEELKTQEEKNLVEDIRMISDEESMTGENESEDEPTGILMLLIVSAGLLFAAIGRLIKRYKL